MTNVGEITLTLVRGGRTYLDYVSENGAWTLTVPRKQFPKPPKTIEILVRVDESEAQ